jgi:hypothetical protein
MTGEEINNDSSPSSKKEETVSGYFNTLKAKKQQTSDAILKDIYDNCIALLNKYNITNQMDAMKKLIKYIDMIEKERKAVAVGIDTFVYKKDVEEIEKYFESVGKNIRMIELSRYEREIPDDVVEKYEKVKFLFDEFIVVFTDYTKEKEHDKKTIKDRDPILFGVFMADDKEHIKGKRMYFIGDWEDEFCDLTLDKLVEAMAALPKNKDRTDVVYKFRDPVSIDEIRAKINTFDQEKSKGRMLKTNTTYNDKDDTKDKSKHISILNIIKKYYNLIRNKWNQI